jgi:hypothetical protein
MTAGAQDRRESFGAVAAPATLPPGGAAAYALAGVPELGVGYRYAMSSWEADARLKFNYLQLSLAAEFVAKIAAARGEEFEWAPYLGLGVVGNSGSQYFDNLNFGYFGLRPLVGLISTYALAETVRAVIDLSFPYDLPLGSAGGMFRPSVAAGLEIYLGNDITGLFMGQAGLDALKEPGGVSETRVSWGARLGLGIRLF